MVEMMPMGRLGWALGIGLNVITAVNASAAWTSYDNVEDLLKCLNSPQGLQELGLKEVRRPADVSNRLDVVFQDGVSSDQRHYALHKIGQQFLMILFEFPGIPTVSVVERNASGVIVNRATVTLAGAPGGESQAHSSSAPMRGSD